MLKACLASGCAPGRWGHTKRSSVLRTVGLLALPIVAVYTHGRSFSMDIRDSDTARAWVDVDLGALVANYKSLSETAKPRVGVMPVVKADAYGLGVGPVVAALEALEPWGYAVATATEGAELRELGIERPVLTLFSTPDELEFAASAQLTPAIGDSEALGRWSALAERMKRRLPFHLEIDTGMGRAGFRYDAVEEWLPGVQESTQSLDWEGTFTHFHSSKDEAPSAGQWSRFQDCLKSFPSGAGGYVHVASSAAAARGPEHAADLIRPGIFLYGGIEDGGNVLPRPVAALKARVLAVREVPEGWTASYGATYTAARRSRWATIALGYGDGLRRELSNNGFVRFGDREAPIVGRVCMDVTIVDVTQLDDIKPGDVAIAIGGPHVAPMSLTNVAARCRTIEYEILTGFSRRLPRCYQTGVTAMTSRGQTQTRGSDG